MRTRRRLTTPSRIRITRSSRDLTTSFAPAGLDIDSLNSLTVPAGATTVATINAGRATHARDRRHPAESAASFASGGGNFGGRRVFFTVPDYPDKAEPGFRRRPHARTPTTSCCASSTSSPRTNSKPRTPRSPARSIDVTNAGFTGTGYVDFGATPGQFIEWTVNVPQAGLYSLGIPLRERLRRQSAARAPRQRRRRPGRAGVQSPPAPGPPGTSSTEQVAAQRRRQHGAADDDRRRRAEHRPPRRWRSIGPIVDSAGRGADEPHRQRRLVDADQPVLDRQRDQRNRVPGRAAARLGRIVHR